MSRSTSGAATVVDIVDSNDIVIRQVPRQELKTHAFNFRVAHVFVFNDAGDLLLGQLGTERTDDPGLWGSSVAAHLWAGETYAEAAQRRLFEELGINNSVDPVDKLSMSVGEATKFVGLFRAHADGFANREPEHIADLEFVSFASVARDVANEPGRFTPTFRLLVARYAAADL